MKKISNRASQIQKITDLIQAAITAFQQIVHSLVEGFIAVVALIDEDLAAKFQAAADTFLAAFDEVVGAARSAAQVAGSFEQLPDRAAAERLPPRLHRGQPRDPRRCQRCRQRGDQDAQAALTVCTGAPVGHGVTRCRPR